MHVHRLFIDYRHFDAAKIAPRFEFGFGLSYTTFEYSDLIITPVGGLDRDGELEANWLAGKPGPRGVGASTALWLHRPVYKVSFAVQNTGQVAGTEVRFLPVFLSGFLFFFYGDDNADKQIAQLYLHFPAQAGEPPSVLRGFTDVELQPGESTRTFITLSRYDLSIWDVSSKSWVRSMGTYTLSVGGSSRDFRLKCTIPLY